MANSFVGVASPLDSHSRSDHFFIALLADPEVYSQQTIVSVVRDGFESRVRGASLFRFLSARVGRLRAHPHPSLWQGDRLFLTGMDHTQHCDMPVPRLLDGAEYSRVRAECRMLGNVILYFRLRE